MKLKWKETFDLGVDQKVPVTFIPSYPECSPSYYKLQQCWEDSETKKSLWKDVEAGQYLDE